MESHELIISKERIESKILFIRDKKVMLDSDLAELYGVTTKRLNEQVKRNSERFPVEFMFRLSAREKTEVVANCDHLQNLKYSPTLPYVFTKYGTIMLASVLNSPTAVKASIQVVKVFVRLREILATHKDLARKLQELERKYDTQFKVVFEAIRELMEPPLKKEPKRRIGFHTD